jgi:glycerol-3-phosphate O-acyltransferase
MGSFIASLWTRHLARPRVLPEGAVAQLQASTVPLCVLLETDSSLDQQVIERLLRQPEWQALIAQRNQQWPGATMICLQRWAGLFNGRLDRRLPHELRELVTTLMVDVQADVQLLPVNVFWGRAPDKESSWLSLPFAESWREAGVVRRYLAALINGRQLIIRIGEPLSLRAVLQDAADASVATRRVARACRHALYQQRSAALGPELASRERLAMQVLASQAVRQAMRAEMQAKNLTREQAIKAAQKCIYEISANYSHVTVSWLARLFKHVWNHLYDGVEVHHIDRVRAVASTHEIVYVPCHRSHMDYLLLSYVIYHHGFAVPHVAAGINLNLPLLGRVLRRGGAFFIRRSFAGSALYTAVFTKYLGLMMARGHSVEYFIEGGRSRTGRLLSPKTGALTMTVRSFLRDPQRPVMFMPVYFGYERIVEGATYINELSGRPKQKETLLGVFRTLPALKHMGRVHVSFGEPLALDELLNQYAPHWRGAPVEDRPQWLSPLVNDLALRIMRNINSAAFVTPVNLLALVLLPTPKQALLEADLLRQLKLYAVLLRATPYAPQVGVTDMEPAAIVDYAERMQVLTRQRHDMGDVLSMSEANAVQMTYFRNNVLHLMVMPSAIASCFLNNRQIRNEDLQRLAWRIYPYMSDELFLRWNEDELNELVKFILRDFAAHGLLETHDDGATWSRPRTGTAEAVQLSLLGQLTMQIIERYYLAIALLLKAGSGRISQDALEQQCHLVAQHMSLLYELNSPEFFDKSLFKNFLDLLRARGVLGVNAEGRLTYTDMLFAVADDAQMVLHEQIRNSVLQVTHR